MPETASVKNLHPGNVLLAGLNLFILTIFAFSCIYPFYFIFINSLSSSQAVLKGVFFLPVDFTLASYKELQTVSGLSWAILISIARTVSGSLLTMVCSSFAAYILTRRNTPAKKIIYRFFIFTMYINAGFIPYYLLISRLGLINNFLVYILPGAVSAYYIILIKTYIESMPTALWESAEIDGAGVLRIYFKIIVPLAKPILACIIVFAAVGQWNAWSDDLFFMRGSKARFLHCLQFLLYSNLSQNMSTAVKNAGSAAAAAAIKVTPMTLRMAMTFITVLPILCVYPLMQRYFTKGIMLGAIKG
jgi:multiple sugar transport system permease protein/putative aldouronate transport system permease protein